MTDLRKAVMERAKLNSDAIIEEFFRFTEAPRSPEQADPQSLQGGADLLSHMVKWENARLTRDVIKPMVEELENAQGLLRDLYSATRGSGNWAQAHSAIEAARAYLASIETLRERIGREG